MATSHASGPRAEFQSPEDEIKEALSKAHVSFLKSKQS